jgi:hypothetical protein
MVTDAEPVPLPLHTPEVVIATFCSELAIAETLKLVLYVAFTGAWGVIVWLAFCAVVDSFTSGAAL